MIAFDYSKLALVLLGTLLLIRVAINVIGAGSQHHVLLGALGGLFIYSGIGSASSEVTWEFMLYYFLLFVSITVGYFAAIRLFSSVQRGVENHLAPTLDNVNLCTLSGITIIVYVILVAFPLMFPQFRLHDLLTLRPPEIEQWWTLRFTQEPDVVTRISKYARWLITPFYFVALYRLKNRLSWVLAVFLLTSYLEYVSNHFIIGRGELMGKVCMFAAAAWYLRPHYRRMMAIVAVLLCPLVLWGLHLYGRVRIGADATESGFWESVSLVLCNELSFPEKVGMAVFESERQLDFGKYLTWVGSLPIPKVITGPIDGTEINLEISEIVFGKDVGDRGAYVVLGGLVTESVYIYGRHFAWLHGIFIGGLAAWFSCLLGRVPHFLFLYLYVMFNIAYKLNRAGVAAVLPSLVNEFLLFYCVMFWIVTKSERCSVCPVSGTE